MVATHLNLIKLEALFRLSPMAKAYYRILYSYTKREQVQEIYYALRSRRTALAQIQEVSCRSDR